MKLTDAWIDLIAGWCSGAATVLALQPLDTILTRRQAGLMGVHLGPSASGAMLSPHFMASTTTALWRGTSPMISAVPFQNALLMGGYGLGLQYAQRNDGDPNTHTQQTYWAIFIGGCTGGVLQSFLMSPVELVKVSQQCGTSTWSHLWRNHIARGQWHRGLVATLLRDGIPHGVWFVAYQGSKDFLQSSMFQQRLEMDDASVSSSSATSGVASVPVAVPLISGAVAATVAWLVGYPADLIKTRIQARPEQAGGILETGRELIREAQGSIGRGLYRGLGLKLLRAIPASMIGFSVYEVCKEQIEKVTR